jgi:hypothetical protein
VALLTTWQAEQDGLTKDAFWLSVNVRDAWASAADDFSVKRAAQATFSVSASVSGGNLTGNATYIESSLSILDTNIGRYPSRATPLRPSR